MVFNNIRQRIEPELDRLNAYISESVHSPMPFLNDIVERFLERRGKQVRPLLVILSAELLGGITDEVLHAGASIELLHNATLVHDDIIDESKLRRGQPTLNATWDNQIAVLTGDYLVSRSLDQSIKADSLEIVRMMSHLADVLSMGELHQIFVARDHMYSMRKYVRTIEMKTAILFESCVRIGAEALGVTPERAANLVRFAYYMGVCFQIKDDVFDYVGTDAIGKASGHDLLDGKATLPLLYALQTAPEDARREAMDYLEKDELTDEDVRRLTTFAVDNGGIEFCERVMERIREKALKCLYTYPDCAARKDLEGMFTYIIERNT